MAIKSFQLDPNHIHQYRKIKVLCIDGSYFFPDPQCVDLVDDGEVWVKMFRNIKGVGLRSEISETGEPT